MPISRDPRARARQIANLKRGGAKPPPPGNQLARRHGAYAQIAAERVDAKVLRVFEALSEDVPLKEEGRLPAADGVAVRLLAEVLVRLDDVSAYLTRYGLFDEKTKQPRAALDVEGRLRREAADHADALGMTPRSRARLGLDLQRTVDLATAMSHPDAEVARALLRRMGALEPEEDAC